VSAPVVRSFHHADSGTWTHVVVDPSTRRAAIIDAVLDYDAPSGTIRTASAQRVLEYVATAELTVDWVLETHAHADHLSAGAWICERTGAKLGAGVGIIEVQRTFKRLLALGDDFAADGSAFDRLFEDGETFELGDIDVRVLAMPGHTTDSIAYIAGDAVFVGDTLFAPKSGTARCDFPGGDASALHASIRRLYELPDATRVFLCHDYPAADAAPVAEIALAEQKRGNIHVCHDTDAAKFVALRTTRDATLAVPKLLWPAVQFNIRGGRVPADGAFFKLPVAFAADEPSTPR
jgi:glyoxylase-like metal-dependent hydrolase (beta-lactamase superfamily II)